MAEWGVSENNRPARYYRIRAAGRKQLQEEREKWEAVTEAIGLVLRGRRPESGLTTSTPTAKAHRRGFRGWRVSKAAC